MLFTHLLMVARKNGHEALTVTIGMTWAFQLFGGLEKIGP